MQGQLVLILLFVILPSSLGYHVAISSACMSHLYGTLPFAKLLVAKGHKVTYVTTTACKERVTEAGANLYVEKEWNIRTIKSILSENPIIENYNKLGLFKNWSIEVSVETYQWVNSLPSDKRPDILMSHPFCYNISTVADYFNIPFVVYYSNGLSFPTKAKSKVLLADVSAYISENSLIYSTLTKLQWTIMSHILDLMLALKDINQIRQDMTLQQFSRYFQMVRSYPTICPFSEPFVNHGQVENFYRISLTKFVNSKKEIDVDVIEWLNQSKKPVIYMALGTSTLISDSMIQMFIQAFEEQTDFRILWSLLKRSNEIREKTKSHILIKKFLPQIPIFQRKEVVAFISHCGAASILEATSLEVPIIFFPQGRDQNFVASNANMSGIGVYLETPSTADDIKNVLLQFKNRQSELRKNIAEVRRGMDERDEWNKFDSMIKSLIKKRASSRFQIEDEFGEIVKDGTRLLWFILVLVMLTLGLSLYSCIKCFCKRTPKLKKN